ncbi:type VI secretion system lipoprotein TssJ, partial [Salmonella enterica]
QSDANTVLGADLVAEKDVWVRPGNTVSLDMLLDEKAQYVALVAQFRSPDARKNGAKNDRTLGACYEASLRLPAYW